MIHLITFQYLIVFIVTILCLFFSIQLDILEQKKKISFGVSCILSFVNGGIIGTVIGLSNLSLFFIIPYIILTFPPIIKRIKQFLYPRL